MYKASILNVGFTLSTWAIFSIPFLYLFFETDQWGNAFLVIWHKLLNVWTQIRHWFSAIVNRIPKWNFGSWYFKKEDLSDLEIELKWTFNPSNSPNLFWLYLLKWVKSLTSPESLISDNFDWGLYLSAYVLL